MIAAVNRVIEELNEKRLSSYIDLSEKQFLIADRYKIIRQLGEGAFGAIFLVIDNVTQEKCAAKLERKKVKQPQLCYESKIYEMLQDTPGVATMKYYGPAGCDTKYNALVMTLLGPSLDKLFAHCGKKFSTKTVLMIADQVLVRICSIHSHGLIHRDIKPDNFLIGLGNACTRVYICDFGLSKKYMTVTNKNTRHHIPFREDKFMIGTARYCSLNSHAEVELSRRDDLEAIGYMLIYFLRGNLPWQGIKSQSKRQKKDFIQEKKLATSIPELCKNLPEEFARYITYTRKLQFTELPDYKMLQDMFKKLYLDLGYNYDSLFDWVLLVQKNRKNTT